MNASRVMRVLLLLLAALGAVAGCNTGVAEKEAERRIRERLPEIVGPANQYKVNVRASSDLSVARGSLREIIIEGREVQIGGLWPVDDLYVALDRVRVDLERQTLEEVGAARFQASIRPRTLARYLSDDQENLRDVRVQLQHGVITVSGRYLLVRLWTPLYHLRHPGTGGETPHRLPYQPRRRRGHSRARPRGPLPGETPQPGARCLGRALAHRTDGRVGAPRWRGGERHPAPGRSLTAQQPLSPHVPPPLMSPDPPNPPKAEQFFAPLRRATFWASACGESMKRRTPTMRRTQLSTGRLQQWTKLALVLLLGALPVAARGAVTPAEELEVGRQVAASLEARHGRLNDARRLQRVTQVGRRLEAAAGRKQGSISFRLLDADDFNALALPGGFVYVTRGLVDRVRNEDELAAALAHELAHIVLGHTRQLLEEEPEQRRVIVIVENPAPDGATTERRVTISEGSPATPGVRAKELDADREAVTILRQAGYRAEMMIPMLGHLRRSAAADARIPINPEAHDFLSTHPAPADRIRRLMGHLNAAERKRLGAAPAATRP